VAPAEQAAGTRAGGSGGGGGAEAQEGIPEEERKGQGEGEGEGERKGEEEAEAEGGEGGEGGEEGAEAMGDEEREETGRAIFSREFPGIPGKDGRVAWKVSLKRERRRWYIRGSRRVPLRLAVRRACSREEVT